MSSGPGTAGWRAAARIARTAPSTWSGAVVGLAAFALLAAGCPAPRPVAMPDGAPRFTALGNGTVRDDATRLVWAQNANLAGIGDPWGGLTWAEANEFVAEMSSGRRPTMGCTAWRLPTAPELKNLIDAFWRRYSNYTAMAATKSSDDLTSLRNLTTPFESFAETAYWSSTQARHGTPAGGADAGADGPGSGSGPGATDGSGPAPSAAEPAVDPPFAVAVSTTGAAFPLAKTDRKRVWPVCSPTAAPERSCSTRAPGSPCSRPS